MQNKNHWIYSYLEIENSKAKNKIDHEIGEKYMERLNSKSLIDNSNQEQINLLVKLDFNSAKLSDEDKTFIKSYLLSQCEVVRLIIM